MDGNTFQFNPLLRIAFLSHNEMDSVEEDLLKDKTTLKRVDLGENNLSNVGNILSVSKIIVIVQLLRGLSDQAYEIQKIPKKP